MSKAVSKAEFARAVELSKARISQLVHEGLPVDENGRIDLDAGRQWLADNRDTKRRPHTLANGRGKKDEAQPSDTGSLAAARREKAETDAERSRLELEQFKGSLIDKAEAERTIFNRARAERDAWMAWPLRVASDMAAELRVDEAKLLPALKRSVRAHLSELAEAKHDEFG